MKTLEECLAWITAVESCVDTLPEGVAIKPNYNQRNGCYTLRDVDPEAIKQLSERFNQPTNEQRYDAGAFYSTLEITWPAMEGKGLGDIAKFKNNRKRYCFFYRKTSDNVPAQKYIL